MAEHPEIVRAWEDGFAPLLPAPDITVQTMDGHDCEVYATWETVTFSCTDGAEFTLRREDVKAIAEAIR